jgi:lipoyl(octanoyl) transferase
MFSPAETSSAALSVLDWGRTEYRAACTRQETLVTQRIAGAVADTLVFTEHDPVFTIGLRRGAETHLVWDTATLAQAGVAVANTNRGGDITYHGPGQIVGYPILSLAARKDLHAYLRFLEKVLSDSLHVMGLQEAGPRPGKTGIWIGRRKIAAIGVAVRRWVTYHGFALNVRPDLHHFTGIIPCGITADDGSVTSMTAELGHPVDLEAVKQVIVTQFKNQISDLRP